MPIDDDEAAETDRAPENRERRTSDASERGSNREKVIVRSNGTVTYVGKDMAYQFWKFGLLGRDFHYRVFAGARCGLPVWATCAAPNRADAGHPTFGGAGAGSQRDRRPAVVPARSSSSRRSRRIGTTREAEHSVHLSYEMVALTHNTARQLGYTLSARGAARPFVEVSGRKGLGVKADDLLDVLAKKASGRSRSETRTSPARRVAAHRRGDRHRRGPVLHGAILPREGDRLRHRRGAELRG